MVARLASGPVKFRRFAHLPPGLNAAALPRGPGWLPLFGQEAAAQGHLPINDIEASDVLLLFPTPIPPGVQTAVRVRTARPDPTHVDEPVECETGGALGATSLLACAEPHPHPAVPLACALIAPGAAGIRSAPLGSARIGSARLEGPHAAAPVQHRPTVSGRTICHDLYRPS